MWFRLVFCAAGAVALIFASSCNGTECGPGTVNLGGSCVPGGTDGGPTDCASGTVPGPEGCVPAADPADRRPCDGRFGPVAEDDAKAIFVDASYDGGDSDGTVGRPFVEIADAVAAAADGDLIGVAGGTYTGGFTLDRPLTVEGRCAGDVIIEGGFAVEDTGDVAVRGVTVTKGAPGVAVSNVEPIEAEAGLELRYVRLTMNDGAGLLVEKSDVLFLDSEAKRTASVSDEARETGAGIIVLDGSNFVGRLGITAMNGFIGVDSVDFLGDVVPTAATAPSEILLDRMSVLGNGGGGVRVGFDDAQCDELPAEGSPGLTVLASEVSNNDGDGIHVSCRPLSVVGSTIAANLEDGVEGASSPATVAGNDLSGRTGGGQGRGVLLSEAPAVVSGNRLDGFQQGGVQITGAASAVVSANDLSMNGVRGIALEDVRDVTVNDNEVTGTQATSLGLDGHAIDVRLDAEIVLPPISASIRDNHLAENGGAGINVTSFQLGRDIDEYVYVVDGNRLEDNGFYAINIQSSSGGQVSDNEISGGAGYGVRAIGVASGSSDARLYLVDNTISDISSSGENDGDCLLLYLSHITVDGNALTDCARHAVYAVDGSSGTVRTDKNTVSGSGSADYAHSGTAAVTFTPDTSVVASDPFDGQSVGAP